MITEALIEMHFHKEMVNLFTSVFGKNYLRILKPSPQNETWVGFDQGWVSTSLSMKDFFQDLKSNIQSSSTSSNLFLGYFFQYKPVSLLRRSSALKPTTYTTPYYRSEISLGPSQTTGISQHETLLRLINIKNCHVYYACAMLFNLADIYEDADLNKLRFVDVSTSPPGWSTNTRHFITFQTENDPNPYWCSEPIQTRSLSINQVAENLKLLTREELLELLENVTFELQNEKKIYKKFNNRFFRSR